MHTGLLHHKEKSFFHPSAVWEDPILVTHVRRCPFIAVHLIKPKCLLHSTSNWCPFCPYPVLHQTLWKINFQPDISQGPPKNQQISAGIGPPIEGLNDNVVPRSAHSSLQTFPMHWLAQSNTGWCMGSDDLLIEMDPPDISHALWWWSALEWAQSACRGHWCWLIQEALISQRA